MLIRQKASQDELKEILGDEYTDYGLAIALAVVPQVNYITGSMTNPSGAYIMEIFKLEEDVTMVPVIDKRKTGEQIRKYMNLRGLTVQDVKTYLSLGCVQSVYHWLDGQSAPNLDNLYALSELLRVPMDLLVAGNRSYKPEANLPTGAIRLLRYYRLLYECIAA